MNGLLPACAGVVLFGLILVVAPAPARHAFSLLSGYWPNAALNTVFLALFIVPLLGIRPHLDAEPACPPAAEPCQRRADSGQAPTP